MSDDRPDLGVRHRTRPTVGEQPDPMARLVRVLGPIQPGSLIVAAESVLGVEPGQMDNVMEAVREAVGHDRWLFIVVPDTDAVRVLGPDDVAVPFRQVLAVLTEDRDVDTFYSYAGRIGPPVAHDDDCGLDDDHPGLCAP